MITSYSTTKADLNLALNLKLTFQLDKNRPLFPSSSSIYKLYHTIYFKV